ncbi:hypothetical protein CQ12_39580 [Bradyrhizobium jicamae]|uniref:Uncharacterized protein n=1 Tax=Bradyrhizobium jicamae TaxID=280332 RepID=A0A0R3LD16_9BRAD|nr:hypothetical protein CQ12_39580 [Bradyrhizobium jicamae]
MFRQAPWQAQVRDEYRTGRSDQTDGQKTENPPDFAGFFDLAIAAPSMKAALEAWAQTAISFIRARRR